MTHRRHIPRLFTAAVCAALGASVLLPATGAAAAQGLPRATADRPDDRPGPKVRYLYLVPAGVQDKRLDTTGTIADSVDAGNRWLQERTGRLLDTDTAGGVLDVSFVRLPRTAAQYEAAGVLGAVQDDLRAMGQDDGQDVLMGYYAGVDGSRRCGESYIGPGRTNDRSFLALVYDVQPDGFSSCTSEGFAGEGEPARTQDITMVHELFHAAGAVTDCAPHADGTGHVSDDDTDLMARAGDADTAAGHPQWPGGAEGSVGGR